MPRSTRMRNCVITAWNEIPDSVLLKGKINFMIWQQERCPKTEKDHYQIYVEFFEGLNMNNIKDLFEDKTLHIEPRKGSQDQAIAYCSKEETRVSGPFKYGKKSQQGYRSDLDSIMDYIEDNSTAREILLQFRGNAIRHISAISRSLAIYHSHGPDGDLDKMIQRKRGTLEFTTTTEVGGNTTSPTSCISDNDEEYICPRCDLQWSSCKCPKEEKKKLRKKY